MVQLDNKEIGKRINSIRIEKGDNLREFGERIARKMNIPKDQSPADSLVSRWEKGKNRPNNERLKAIADIGGISVESILYGVDIDKIFERCIKIMSDDKQEFLRSIKTDLIPLLYERIQKFGDNNKIKEDYIADRIISIANAYSGIYNLNIFDHFLSEDEFPTLEEDLNYFSERIPNLKDKKFTFIPATNFTEAVTLETVDKIIKSQFEISDDDRHSQAIKDTKDTFLSYVSTSEQIDELKHSNAVYQVFNANLEYQNNESDIRIYDANSYINYLEFVNSYFNELLNNDDYIEMLANERKNFGVSTKGNAKRMLVNSFKDIIFENNKMIQSIKDNLNK